MPSIEPSIGPPGQSVDAVVLGFERPSVEMYERPAIGCGVPISIRDEREMRRCCDPHAAKSQLEPGEMRQAVAEPFPSIQHTVAIRIVEDQNPIVTLVREFASVV